MKRFQSETQEIKNYIESMGSISDQCEDRISELEDGDAFKNKLLQGILKTAQEHEKWIQQFVEMQRKLI